MLRQTSGLFKSDFAKDREKQDKLPFSGWASNKALFMLGINYRWSQIVFDERGPNGLSEETLKAHAYGGHETKLGAGDRAPDAPGFRRINSDREVSLFDILNPTKHTVLIFLTDKNFDMAEEILKMIPREISFIIAVIGPERKEEPQIKADLFLNDSSGYAHKYYYAADGNSTVIIIRPDGYIGGICKSVYGVKQYYSRIFTNVSS